MVGYFYLLVKKNDFFSFFLQKRLTKSHFSVYYTTKEIYEEY